MVRRLWNFRTQCRRSLFWSTSEWIISEINTIQSDTPSFSTHCKIQEHDDISLPHHQLLFFFFCCSHCPISELPVVDNMVVIDFGESDLGFFLLFHLCKSVHLCCTDAAGGIYQWANMDTFPSLLKLRVKMHKHTPQTRDVRLICSNSDQKKSLKSDLGQ